MRKRRATVTVDGDLLEAATDAVAEGHAHSLSAWIGEAMAQRHERDRRLGALDSLITTYEAEHGVISDEELADQAQADRDAAAARRSSGSKAPE